MKKSIFLSIIAIVLFYLAYQSPAFCDETERIYLPEIARDNQVTPPPPTVEPTLIPTPVYDARKGAVLITSADSVTKLGAGWWYSYRMDRTYDASGFVPMIRDPYRLADFRDSGWSTDTIAYGATVLFYNEPNLVDQMYGLELSPEDVAIDLHELHVARPDLKIVGPAIYYYPSYYWTHEDFIEAYERLYGDGSLPIVAAAIHAIDCNVLHVTSRINLQIALYDAEGYRTLPIYVTEYMKGNWSCYPNPETCEDVAEGVWNYYKDNPRIERMCWFPARWEESWTDPGGVSWMSQRLLTSENEWTSVGEVYAGLGE